MTSRNKKSGTVTRKNFDRWNPTYSFQNKRMISLHPANSIGDVVILITLILHPEKD